MHINGITANASSSKATSGDQVEMDSTNMTVLEKECKATDKSLQLNGSENHSFVASLYPREVLFHPVDRVV